MNNNIGIACKITTGKLDANQAIQNGQYPFYTCAEFPDTIDSFAFDDDVVLVAGNNAKGNFHVNRFKGKFNAYQRTYVLTAKKGFDIDFIYYSLKLELKRLKEKSQGSQTKFLTMPILQNIGLKNLSESEQKQISSVLSTLDEKIALNNQINATLEQMAKTLYDYWFVQFDFPDDNGKPYKTSGGEMVYNETLKRDIPKGWGVKQLNQLITVKDGTHNSPRYVENGYPLVTSKNLFSSGIDFSNTNKISESDFIEINKRSKVDNGDILFSMIGNIGTIYKVEETDINFAIKNVALFKSSENLELKNYFFQYFHSHDMQSYMKSVISGSIQKFIGLESLRKTPILFNEEVIKKFQIESEGYFNLINNLNIQNRKLIELRDWLLPMLMNGQVTVQ